MECLSNLHKGLNPGFEPQPCINQVWLVMPTIPALGKQRQRIRGLYSKSKTGLGYSKPTSKIKLYVCVCMNENKKRKMNIDLSLNGIPGADKQGGVVIILYEIKEWKFKSTVQVL